MNLTNKKDCCGCNACYSICPAKCISIEFDEEGFSYPKIDKDKCINCGLCEKVCPFNPQNEKATLNKIKAYACRNKDKNEQLTSSSGGVFIELCNYIINNNGIVFGALFNEDLKVVHKSAKNMQECYKFKGSKYVQSYIGDTYIEAKKYLDEGKLVLFSGTQCQIKGLNLFLRKDYSNLITLEVICHGAPSPLVLDKYKKHLIKRYNANVKNIQFRDKGTGWENYSVSVELDNNKKHSTFALQDIYMKGFLQDLYLRPSCYNCKAKNFCSKSDITLGDYWGIRYVHPNFYDNNGVSLVCLNTDKGINLFELIKDKFHYVESDINIAKIYNPSIYKSVSYNNSRDKFFKEIINDTEDIESVIKKYIN